MPSAEEVDAAFATAAGVRAGLGVIDLAMTLEGIPDWQRSAVTTRINDVLHDETMKVFRARHAGIPVRHCDKPEGVALAAIATALRIHERIKKTHGAPTHPETVRAEGIYGHV